MKLNEAQYVTCIITYYYLACFLLNISVFVITLLLHYYCALLHLSLLRVVTVFDITL